VGPEGNLYLLVTDQLLVNANVEACDAVLVKDPASGETKHSWGNGRNECAGANNLCVPRNIAVDAHGNVYVDRANGPNAGDEVHTIQKFTNSGDSIAKWDRKGCGLGNFLGNSNGEGILLTVDRSRGDLLVQDGLGFKAGVNCGILQRLSASGHHLASYRTLSPSTWQDATSGVAVGSGAFLLARGTFNQSATDKPWRLLQIDAAGRIVRALRAFSTEEVEGVKIDADAEGRIYIPKKQTCKILRFDPMLGTEEFLGEGCGEGAGKLTQGAGLAVDIAPTVRSLSWIGVATERRQGSGKVESTDFLPMEASSIAGRPYRPMRRETLPSTAT